MKIPDGWKTELLEQVCKLKAGKFISASEIYGYTDGLSDDFYPCFGGNGIRGYVKHYSHNGVYPLIGRQGALCGNVNIARGKFYATEHAVVVSPKSDVDAEWLFYKLTNKNLNRYATGVAQPGLSVERINKIPILLPPLPEQKAIADLLSIWDAAIEKTEQLIAAKEKQFQWLLDELITKPSKSGKWKEVEIGNLLRESRIPDTGNLVEKRLSVRLHLKGIEVRDTRGTEAEGATNYFIRRKGQFIYGKQNVFRGAIGIVPKELDGYSTTQDLPAFDFVGKVDPIWFLWFFSRPSFYEGLEKFATGSGSKRLHPEMLFSIKINLPPVKEQANVAQYLDFANRELNRLKQLAEQYKLQKRGLMQRLLTGQWRLKEFT